MKKIFLSILIVFSVCIIQLHAAVKIETINKTIDFRAEKIFIHTLEGISDYVYLIGSLKDGTKIAYQVGGKHIKSALTSKFRFNSFIIIGDKKCSSVAEIEENARATWYSLYVGEWRGVEATNKMMTVLLNMGVKHIIINEKSKDQNVLKVVEPLSKERLQIISE